MRNLQTFLDEHQIRHKDLAFITGCTTRSVFNWIMGVRPLPRSTELLLQALDLKLFETFHGAPQNGMTSSIIALLSGTASSGSVPLDLTRSTVAPGKTCLAARISGKPSIRRPISSSV